MNAKFNVQLIVLKLYVFDVKTMENKFVNYVKIYMKDTISKNIIISKAFKSGLAFTSTLIFSTLGS